MIDIALTEENDILLDGDIRYVESTGQHEADLLAAAPGDYAGRPEAGVGTADYLMDNSPNLFLREVRKQLQADGMTVQALKTDNEGNLIIDGHYNE